MLPNVCRGDNELGTLGIPLGYDGMGLFESTTPQAVVGIDDPVQDIVISDRSACALGESQKIWCWGAQDVFDGTSSRNYGAIQIVSQPEKARLIAGGGSCV